MNEFNKKLNRQVEELLEKGQFIDSHSYNNYCMLLYSIGKDFLELYYDSDTGEVIWVGIANEHDLKKYLDKVSINFDRLFH